MMINKTLKVVIFSVLIPSGSQKAKCTPRNVVDPLISLNKSIPALKKQIQLRLNSSFIIHKFTKVG